MDRDSGDRKIVPEGCTGKRGWLGCPRITDDVKGLGNHVVANDVCLCSVTSHVAVLPSINPRGSAE
jgi:hypothetical protein